MNYQILFTDLDGTLLDDWGQVTPANREAIQLAQQAGKKIVLCSGRSWRSLMYFEQDLGLDKPGCYGVSFNGGMVYTNPSKKFLLRQYLENSLGLELVHALKQMDGEILIYAGEDLLAEKETEILVHYSTMTRIPATIINSFTEITDDFVKILVKGPRTLLEEVEREMKPRFAGSPCNIFFSAPELMEIGPLNGHKGYGVRFLANHLNIPMEAVITLGDEGNDITMLEAAGLGIAVANAVPSAREAADVVLKYTNNQDAFRHVVHRYLLE